MLSIAAGEVAGGLLISPSLVGCQGAFSLFWLAGSESRVNAPPTQLYTLSFPPPDVAQGICQYRKVCAVGTRLRIDCEKAFGGD